MDLIRISDTKLKIMLTSSDMTHYDLHCDSVSITDAHVRGALRRLLADAKQQTGFDGDVSHLYVQMYPCPDGGCELFIAKTDIVSQDTQSLPVPTTNTRSCAIRAVERHGHETCAYSFACLSDVITLCKRLLLVGFVGKTSLYIDHKHTYYLILYDFPRPSLYSPDEYCFICEYGNRESARAMQTYLGEYCTLLRENDAAIMLSQL